MLKKTLTYTASVIFSLSPLNEAIAQEIGRPNFVTIIIDDMGFSDMGVFGGEIDTPNLDMLANQGTILTNFYSAPTSTPARAMFFTGKDHHKAGIGNMDGYITTRPPQKEAQKKGQGYEGKLSKEEVLNTRGVTVFSKVLKENNYHTMMVGKWDLGDEDGTEDPYNRGLFDETLVLLPGGDVHYLSDNTGKPLTSQPDSYYTKRGRNSKSPYNKNGQEFTEFPPNAFSTDFYTTEAIKMLTTWAAAGKQQPFYLHITHIAPHAPFQAPPDLINKYLPRYQQGWDVIRAERFNKLKSLGYIPATATLPPRPTEVKPWDSLEPNEKQVEARRMAVYAGLVEMLDMSIGKLVQSLKDSGDYDNTLFFIFSDNGAAAIEAGSPDKQKFVNAHFTKDSIQDVDNMGSASSFIAATAGWGMVSNTPFNRFKAETFDGGMHTAAFVHYPSSNAKGIKYSCLTSVMDIAPTILDMAGVAYPDPQPLEGHSMKSIFEGDLFCDPDRVLAFEMDNAKMVRQGNWKLAQQWDVARNRWDSNVYLFNLFKDPFEQNDLHWQYPDKFNELWGFYEEYAEDNQVVEVGPRVYDVKALSTLEDGMILGGTLVNYDDSLSHRICNVAQLNDTVDVVGEIYPPSAHVGKPAQVLAAVNYQPDVEGVDDMWLAFNGKDRFDSGVGVKKWLYPQVENLPTYLNFPGTGDSGLPTRLDVPLYEGMLFGSLTGTYNFWVGYRLQDGTGTLVYNQTPFILKVGLDKSQLQCDK
ncbi:MAG: arylsulfatase [Thioploca sp.]|nr:arylsulfatase [Thioploca sp.]